MTSILALLGGAVAFKEMIATALHLTLFAERNVRLSNRIDVVIVRIGFAEQENIFVVGRRTILDGGWHRIWFLPDDVAS